MSHYVGEKGVQNLIEEFVYKLNEMHKGYLCIDLSQCDSSVTGLNDKRRLIVQEEFNGKPVTIIFSENEKDKIKNNTFSIDRLGVVSCELQEASNQRYRVNLRDYVRYDTIWMNKGNGYACYPVIPINGIRTKVAFFENAFDNPDAFSPRILDVSFEVVPYKDMYKAVNIHDESQGAYIKRTVYFARHIRNGNCPSQFLYNGRFHFLMITLFTGKKYIADIDCPSELKEAFRISRNNWLMMFLNCDDDWKKMRIFNLLSLVSTDIGEKYYVIAHKYLEAYMNGDGKLPDYIGYSLDDCTTDYQKSLLNDILSLKKEKAVCILSKGVWGNEDLIKNIPIYLTLEYFEVAIDYLGQLINGVKKDKKKAKDITMCLEYVLCVFRLRTYKDDDLNKRLSLNNKYVKKLYKYVEELIENKIEIHSFLSLEIKNKGVYVEVPNILYALLLYITGAEGAGDIKIAGLSLDDLTT